MACAFIPAPLSLHALSPEAARFCLDIERFCQKELQICLKGKSLLVAFSGGADSLALLYALHALSRRNGLQLGLGILDHGLREESAEEVLMARNFAEHTGIAFHTRRVDLPSLIKSNGLGLEENGRNERLRFLGDMRFEYDYDWIVTGHQLNDLAEDSLMRLIRGSVWPAQAGMAAVLKASAIVRPMLMTPRHAIEKFLVSLGASWIHDSMNLDSQFFRNRVRQTLLPLFLKENPAFLEHVALRWRLARIDDAFFKGIFADFIPPLDKDGVFLERRVLAAMEPAVRLRLFKAVLDSLGVGQARTDTLLRLHAVWENGEGGKEMRFPGFKRACITNGGIRFFREAGSTR